MMHTILSRTNLMLGAFLLLIATSAGLTLWGLQAQADDALVINLAGRQRMLVQQMTRLAGEAGPAPEDLPALSQAAAAFEQTLHALENGGALTYPSDSRQQVEVPKTPDPRILEQLARVDTAWQRYRPALDRLVAGPSAARAAALRGEATLLTMTTERAVQLYQAASERRLTTLLILQAGFFLAAAALLLAGQRTARRAVIAPLEQLDHSAERIRDGDLDTPVPAAGPLEIRSLARRFEQMRLELRGSRQELLALNQELEARVEQRTRELVALHEVGKEITSQLDLQDVLHSITVRARDLLGAENSFLCLLDEPQQALELQAISGPEEAVRRTRAELHNPFVHEVLETAGGGPLEGPSSYCQTVCRGSCGIMAEAYRASHLAAPLHLKGRTIGALCVGHRQEGAFAAEQALALHHMAGLAATAIENARTYRQAERLASLEERQRIAGEMHDGLAQVVDGLGLRIDQVLDLLVQGEVRQAKAAMDVLRDSVSQASAEVRKAIASLADRPAQPSSLQEQLEALVREHAAAHPGIRWQVELPGCLALPDEDAQQVQGIAREAIANACRHAAAAEIRLRLALTQNEGELTVIDDGCGFDPRADLPHTRQHFGLKIQQARAARLSGRIELVSAPGQGTRLTLTWPLHRLPLPSQENKRPL